MKQRKIKSCIAAAMAFMCFGSISAQFEINAYADSSHTVTVTTDGNGAASADTPVQIANGQVTLTATPNAGYEFDHWEITSTTTSYSKEANIVFVLDTTGSMSNKIEKVKDNLANLVQFLDAKSMGLNMSIIEFSDARNYDGSTVYHTFSNGTHWTSDVSEAVAIFDKVKTGSGWDETPTDAFTQLLKKDGTLNFPAGSVNNYIFMLTDEDYFDFKDTAENSAKNRYPMETWIDKFVNAGVKVTVFTKEYYKSAYEDLFTKTGGMYVDITTEDYTKAMKDFADYLDQTSVTTGKTVYENPYTMTMPDGNVTAKAFFKPVNKSAYTITVVTDGHGRAYASKNTALPGENIGITAYPDSGYMLESVVCIEGGAVLHDNTFVMPAANVVIKVTFKENLTEYIMSGRPYSYIFTYDSEMNLVKINSNRNFDGFPDYVTVKIDLGKEYAGMTGSLCSGRKSNRNVIETITLDENGCYTFKAGIAKNYSFVLDE